MKLTVLVTSFLMLLGLEKCIAVLGMSEYLIQSQPG